MGRLIEVQGPQLPACLTIAVGDLLHFAASGGHVRSGVEVVQMLGPLLSAVLGTNGEILSPMGAPNNVLFLALRAGHASIDVVMGDPWHAPQTTRWEIDVQ
jgi:hypothetical protein